MLGWLSNLFRRRSGDRIRREQLNERDQCRVADDFYGSTLPMIGLAGAAGVLMDGRTDPDSQERQGSDSIPDGGGTWDIGGGGFDAGGFDGGGGGAN
jgi:hypothetical protein